MQRSLILILISLLTSNLLFASGVELSKTEKWQMLAQADEEEVSEEFGESKSGQDLPEAKSPAPLKSSGKNISKASPPKELPESDMPGVAMVGLEFRPNQSGGSILVRTSGPAKYTSRMNQETNQFVLELPGISVHKKYQRPFNTKEFGGAIGIFTAYQADGGRASRVIVQLREPVRMNIQQEGNTLILIPGDSAGGSRSSGGAAGSREVEPEGEPVAVVNGRESKPAGVTYTAENEKKALNATIDEFVSGSMKYYGHPISVSFKDGDIRDVLNFIAEESGLNMVISEEVKGNVSIKLRKIPWDQALIIILQAKQLGYVRQGNILRVAPLEILKREAENTKLTLESQKSLTPMKTKIFRINFADVKSLLTNIKVFLTPNRGQALEDERSNSLIVTDIDETLNKVEELIRRLDRRTPQVLIEAKIVEAREIAAESLGINWQSLQNGVNVGALGTLATGSGTDLSSYIPSSSTGGLSFTSGGRLSELGDLNVILGILETENKVNILASPRILAMNNKSATIRQSSNVSFPETTAGTLGTPAATRWQLQIVPEVEFTVTPQISTDGTVSLNINVARAYAGPPPADNAPYPINQRSATTTLLVRDGDTAVIGGIYQNESTQNETGVPILRKIPLIGRLFTQSKRNLIRSELLLFITPKILEIESDIDTKQAL